MSVFELLTDFVHIHSFFNLRNESLLPAHIYALLLLLKNGCSCERGEEHTNMRGIS